MANRMHARRDFLRADPAARIQRIAEGLAAIRDRIDECAWMIEWAVPHEPPASQVELVELQSRLSEMRRELTGSQDFQD